MKDTAATSPFAALSSQEQKEKWICWQCQHAAEYIPVEAEEKPTPDQKRSVPLPELRLPQEPDRTQTVSLPKPTVRHSQYDAVIKRMKNAQRQATAYKSWSD